MRLAAVFPGSSLQRPAHREGGLVEVDVGPLQSERFSLAEAQGQRDMPAHRITYSARPGQHSTDLFERQRLDPPAFCGR